MEATEHRTASHKRIEENYGFQSSYPEDLKINKRVQKFAEEFKKFSPDAQPIDLDEEDPNEEAGFNMTIEKQNSIYGKKVDWLQMNPITLEES